MAIPFLIGFHPKNSVVALSLREQQVGLTVRFDYPEELDEYTDIAERLAAHIVDDNATGALIVIYRDTSHAEPALPAALLQAFNSVEVPIRDFLYVSSDGWTSLISMNDDETHPLPDFTSSPVTAAHVLHGAPLPAEDALAFADLLSHTPGEVSDQIAARTSTLREKLHAEIVSEEGQKAASGRKARIRTGAEALDDLFDLYLRANRINVDFAAVVLVAMLDVHVRDYAMGLHSDETLMKANEFWTSLVRLAPEGLVAPVATVLAAVAFERGDGAMAQRALDRAFEDRPGYPMASLLRQAIESGWGPNAMAEMRRSLRADVVAAVKGDTEVNLSEPL